MFKHILLATDGSSASKTAAVLAIELARTHGARLTAVYVISPYPYLGVGESNAYGFNAYMAAAQEHAGEAHAAVKALAAEGGVPVAVETRIVEDVGAARGILHTAEKEGADLVVVGSHGRTGLVRLMLGSVANRVVSESAIPVLVTR
jgi:nucleotide-binding universal stress UspA family protein